jgi:hypothetical protein
VIRFSRIVTSLLISHFAISSSQLTSQMTAQIDAFVKLIVIEGASSVRLVGYTDFTGAAIANVSLSHERAEVVAAAVRGELALLRSHLTESVAGEGQGSGPTPSVVMPDPSLRRVSATASF